MSTKQIVCTISIDPIMSQAYVEGGAIDPGLSQSLLARIFRDHLQATYPKAHVSVGYHDSPPAKLRILQPQAYPLWRRRIGEIFTKILQRENWLVSL